MEETDRIERKDSCEGAVKRAFVRSDGALGLCCSSWTRAGAGSGRVTRLDWKGRGRFGGG